MIEVVLILVTGLATGVVSGALGIGGGPVLVPALVIGFGLGQIEAQATALATLAPTTAAGAVAYARRGTIDRRVVLRMVGAGVPGAVLGAYLALQIPGETLARIFAAFLLVAAYRLWASSGEATGPTPAPGQPTQPPTVCPRTPSRTNDDSALLIQTAPQNHGHCGGRGLAWFLRGGSREASVVRG